MSSNLLAMPLIILLQQVGLGFCVFQPRPFFALVSLTPAAFASGNPLKGCLRSWKPILDQVPLALSWAECRERTKTPASSTSQQLAMLSKKCSRLQVIWRWHPVNVGEYFSNQWSCSKWSQFEDKTSPKNGLNQSFETCCYREKKLMGVNLN